MKCPKCSCNIDENTLVCPDCKKVLKLICPKCGTINKKNTCKKCGFVIISRCYKCGKINQTINGECSKCGFSTDTSVAISSSNIDEFACLTIEFTNLNDLNMSLGSTKLADKFKTNLDNLISNYTGSIGLAREIIENVYIIRFNKDMSFADSAQGAIKAAIELQNLITELNYKLNKLAQTSLNCNIAILKRDIYSKASQYKSGFDIKLIYHNKKAMKLLNNLQIITDSYIYEKVCDKYDLSSLTAKFIKNEMMTFFELNLKKYIKIPRVKKEEEELEQIVKLNFLNDNIHEDLDDGQDDIYDIEAINFEELKSNFVKIKSIDLIPEIVLKFQESSKNIVVLKGDKKLAPKTGALLSQIESSLLFKKVFRVTCSEDMKYRPYGFFCAILAEMYNYVQSPKYFTRNNFSSFKETDESEFIKDLINLNPREFPHPEDTRYSIFDLLLNVFSEMSDTLIYVENFEKIDETSLEVLQLIFEEFNNFNIGFLMVGNKEVSLHKLAPSLLTQSYYTEITIKPTPFKDIVKKDLKSYKDILDSYYFEKISQNTKGSHLYFNFALNYLLECGILTKDKGVFAISSGENIFIPTTLDDLIIKRLKVLSKEKNAYKLFGMLLLIGSRVDFSTLNLLQIPNYLEEVKKLVDKEYVCVNNDSVYIQNYGLYRDNFLGSAPLILKQTIAKELLEFVYSSEVTCPAEAFLYNILEKGKQEFIVWENLSRLNASMGDFTAYLNCSIKFLKLLNEHVNENSQKTIDEYKMEVYENISNLLYKYTPDKIQNIAQIILENLEKTSDDEKVISFCNKMLQGCLISGDYSHALELTHKLMSKFPNASINPADSNFDETFFLISLVKIEILFSIGELKECVTQGDDILEVMSLENIEHLKPKHLQAKPFLVLVFDAMSFVALARVFLLRNDLNGFINKLNVHLGEVPEVFGLFTILEKIIRGIRVDKPVIDDVPDDKFSKLSLSLIEAFIDISDYKEFAGKIYHAKISAKLNKLLQLELVFDLLIGYSYFKLGQDEKAASIYYNVLNKSTKSGLKTVTHIGWYLISMLKFEQGDLDVALGIANNAVIQLEKDESSSDFLFYIYRILLSKILLKQNLKEAAQMCLNNAVAIKEKHGLIFEHGGTQ